MDKIVTLIGWSLIRDAVLFRIDQMKIFGFSFFFKKLSCLSNQHLVVSPPTFTVKHYAGAVTYHSDQFCDKNRDILNTDLIQLMQSSSMFVGKKFIKNKGLEFLCFQSVCRCTFSWEYRNNEITTDDSRNENSNSGEFTRREADGLSASLFVSKEKKYSFVKFWRLFVFLKMFVV